MSRQRLIRRLEESPPRLTTYTGLLYAYFHEVGLRHIENEIRGTGHHHRCLETYAGSSHTPLIDVVKRLRNLAGDDFDLLALKCLKGLDRRLHESRRHDRRTGRTVQGFDDRPYRLCHRRNFLADHYDAPTWQVDQSSSFAAYAWYHVLVPLSPVHGFRLECFSENQWASAFLHERFKKITQRDGVLRVMLWPLQTQLVYRDLEDPESKDEIRFIRLCEVENESELNDEVETALRVAQEKEATILIFPELAIPAGTDRKIRQRLRSHGQEGFPMLTLYGSCHLPSEDGRAYVNEAPLLGPDGRELHRHRKLMAFTSNPKNPKEKTEEKKRPVGERTMVGETVSVLETRIGNLVPLICLDLLGDPIRRLLRESHGNVVLVPSLSEKTSAHAAAAADLQVTNRASTFVCNRRFGKQTSPQDPTGKSFYRIPRSDPQVSPQVSHVSEDQKPLPYLLFELDESTSGQLSSKKKLRDT